MKCDTFMRALLAFGLLTGSLPCAAGGQSTVGRNGATTTASVTKPGRSASQPIDEVYTKKIREYTTEPFFLSPLVDLPSAPGRPWRIIRSHLAVP